MFMARRLEGATSLARALCSNLHHPAKAVAPGPKPCSTISPVAWMATIPRATWFLAREAFCTARLSWVVLRKNAAFTAARGAGPSFALLPEQGFNSLGNPGTRQVEIKESQA